MRLPRLLLHLPEQVFFLLLLLLTSNLAMASSQATYTHLDQDFINLNHRIFNELVSTNPNLSSYTDIKQLKQAVSKELSANPARAALTIVANKKLLLDHIDDRDIFYFIQQLLQQNAWKTAEEIYQAIEYESDKVLLSNAGYYFGQYFYQRGDWQQCLHYLEDRYDDLPDKDASYARLITGACYQKLHQQRKALAIYKRIPESSPDYIYARLNAAIASFRQGWWSDARSLIDNALHDPAISHHDEMLNRLNLVLGYALLSKAYYRDAREAFRNIGLDSRYANRALLGIGLTATYQDDYIGGLNALDILKSKKKYGLSVDEAYLVIPTIMGKMGQNLTATAAYNDAIAFYDQRIHALQAYLDKPETLKQAQYAPAKHQLVINDTHMEILEPGVWEVIDNHRRLKNIRAMLSQSNFHVSRKTDQQLTHLVQSFESTLLDIVKDRIRQRIKYLKDYQSQARYGLARLYDNAGKGKKSQ